VKLPEKQKLLCARTRAAEQVSAFLAKTAGKIRRNRIGKANMERKRLYWLDIARGICILCMVITHYYACTIGDSRFIGVTGTWFLVFFFFSAGVCFHPKKSVARFVGDLAAKLLAPYILVTAGMLAYRCTVLGLWQDCESAERLRMSLASLLYALPSAFEDVPLLHTNTIGIGPIWFLPCLFLAEVLYLVLHRLRYRLPIAWALALVAAWSQSKILLPLTFQNACVGCAFIALGDFCRPFVLRYAEWLGEKKWPWSASLTLVGYGMLLIGLTQLQGQGMDLGSNYYNPLSVFSSCVGFWFVISAAVLIQRNAVLDELLAFCGKNSFLILVFHNMDILGLRDWGAEADPMFLVNTLLIYPFLAYLWRRVWAAVRGTHSETAADAEPALQRERAPAHAGAE
jgi:fucose 4-O-acetylase-like acetyltransferase